MPKFDSASSAPPPGAARVRDLNWPDMTTAGAAGNQPQLRCRITGASFGGLKTVFTGFQDNWNFLFGSDCFTLNSTNAAGGNGGSYSWLNSVNVQIRTAPLPYWPADDDWNVTRVVWIAALFGTVATNNDMGFELLSSSAAGQGIIRTPQNGFGFQWAPGGGGNGIVNFISRNVATGLTTVPLATDGVAGYVMRNYNSHELRIFSAMPNAPAFVKVILNGHVLATVPWSGGTLPANGESGAGIAGFYPTLIADSSNASVLCTKFLGIQAGPNESSCF
jgi:hypothetical protein